jgi:hypothetical protein
MKKKSPKVIVRVLNLIASYIKGKLALSYVRLYQDNSTEKRVYIFDSQDTKALVSARIFKEFTAIANKFLIAESLDAQAKKAQLVSNTHYDKTHTALAKFLKKSEFAASNDRKVEVKKVVVKSVHAKKARAKKVQK